MKHSLVFFFSFLKLHGGLCVCGGVHCLVSQLKYEHKNQHYECVLGLPLLCEVWRILAQGRCRSKKANSLLLYLLDLHHLFPAFLGLHFTLPAFLSPMR